MSRLPINASLAGAPLSADLSYPAFLPYGSSDSSVLLQHPLTSLPTAAELDVATVSELDSAITFDSNGMLLGTNRLRFSGLSDSDATAQAKLNSSGQVSFQIEKAGLCNDGTSDGSTVNGATSNGATFIDQFVFQIRGTSSEIYMRLNSALQNISITAVSNTVTARDRYFDRDVASSPAISTVGKSDYITVNIGWFVKNNHGYIIFGIDGVPLCHESWTGPTGTIDNIIDWNSRSGAGNVNIQHYIKNVQVSTKGPGLPYCHDLGKIVIWGDSQPEGYEALSTGAQLDADMGHTIARYLWDRDIFLRNQQMLVVDNGGDAFANHSTGALSANAATSYTNDIVGNSPYVVVWEWATNDYASDTTFDETNFTSALETNVDDIMALSSTGLLVLCTVPSLIGHATEYAEPNNAANLAAGNAAIRAQPARWEAANPGSSKKVVVVDLYTLLGGDTTGNEYWVGEVKGTNDFHHTDSASYIKGQAIGAEIAGYYESQKNQRIAI